MQRQQLLLLIGVRDFPQMLLTVLGVPRTVRLLS
jgi:hypothetical protein